MAVRFEIDEERKIVFFHFSGLMSLEEARDGLRIVRNDPRIRRHFRGLADFSRAEAVDLGFKESVELVDYFRTAGAGPLTGRVAFYVPQRNSIFGVLRQFLAMAGAEDRIRLVTDLAEARAWVGLPPA